MRQVADDIPEGSPRFILCRHYIDLDGKTRKLLLMLIYLNPVNTNPQLKKLCASIVVCVCCVLCVLCVYVCVCVCMCMCVLSHELSNACARYQTTKDELLKGYPSLKTMDITALEDLTDEKLRAKSTASCVWCVCVRV